MKYLLALLLAGCSSFPKRDPAKLIFPFGKYRHDTQVTVRTDPPTRITFQSVVETAADHVHLVALSPMQTTLFTIKDDGAQVKFEIFDESLRQREREIRYVYPLLREVLYADTPKLERGGARITIGAREIVVEHPRFHAVTEVTRL